jgi:alkyldihydroxyacetonephosphate synthase
MRRWNGWGDEANAMDLPDNGREFLEARIGPGHVLPDAGLEEVLARVPQSRLPAHPLIDQTSEVRLRHSRGQSLPDWLAMRSGEFGVFVDGVAFPETSEEVADLLLWCQKRDIAVIPYGGGTSVAGHINPLDLGKPVLTLSLERMNQLINLDETSQMATFGAGTPGPMVEAQLRVHGFTLGHFPQSWELSTIGGWVASRSSGQQSLRYGRIEQLFAGGRIETLKGTLRLSPVPASAAGPDIREMVLGSEGRLGVITEVSVRVTPLPEREKFHVVFFRDWPSARDGARALVQHGVPLSMLRVSSPVETETQLAMAGHTVQISLMEKALRLRGAGSDKCMMTLGITGSRMQYQQSRSQVRQVLSAFRPVFTGTYLGKKWAEKRFLMPYLRESLWQEGYAVDTLETCTPWSNVDNLVNLIETNLRSVLSAEGVKPHVFTHLSHFYPDGCSIYTTYVFPNAGSYSETLARWKQLKETTSRHIVENGGTISHQHGVGKDHAPYLPLEKGAVGMSMIQSLCQHMDKGHILNPGTLLMDTEAMQ